MTRDTGGLFAFELYKELKAAKYGYTATVQNNQTPLTPNGQDNSFADTETDIREPKFNAFSGKGVAIG